MANMSYCRFENTYSDLEDCVEALRNGKDISKSEKQYADRMRELCDEFIELYDGISEED